MANRHYNPWKVFDQENLLHWAVILFVVIVFPVWCFRACRASNDLKNDKTSSEKISFDGTSVENFTWEESALSVKVYDSDSNQVTEMDLEEYLVGVLAAEMPANFDIEALKAQAVAARTYTIKKMPAYQGSGCSHGADICTDSSHCQAYRTASQRRESWGSSQSENEVKLRQAIQATYGQIVTYDNQPIEAFFHSTSGGMTENSENAFSQALPYLKSVASDESDAPRYENKLELSRSEFAKIVNKAYSKAKLNADSLENSIEVLSRFDSGRIDRIRLGGSEISGKQLRNLFSLDSTYVSFEYTKNAVIMHTKGYGHGVGMSQTGANQMAQNGYTYSEILRYYYQNTQLSKMY